MSRNVFDLSMILIFDLESQIVNHSLSVLSAEQHKSNIQFNFFLELRPKIFLPLSDLNVWLAQCGQLYAGPRHSSDEIFITITQVFFV